MKTYKDYLVNVYDKEGEFLVGFSLYNLKNLKQARIEVNRELHFHYKKMPDFLRVEIREVIVKIIGGKRIIIRTL